jgi:hypothetical protein
MSNYIDKAMDVLKLSRRILDDAKAVGASPWRFYNRAGVGRYARDEVDERNAASFAAVLAAYEDAPQAFQEYGALYFQSGIDEFIGDLARSGLPYLACVGQYTMAYHAIRFDKMGRHRFKVSEGLGVLLALTELRGVRSEDLRLPFPAVFLEVPVGVGLKVHSDGKWLPIEGIFIVEDNSDDGTVQGSIHPGRSWKILVTTRLESGDAAQAFFTISLVDGETVDQSIERLRAKQQLALEKGVLSMLPDGEEVDSWVNVWRFALNVMMYATTPDAEADHIRGNPDAESIWRRIQKLPKMSAKREALKAKLKDMDQKPTILLGKSVRFTPALREMRDAREEGGGTVLRVRTLVKGHYQRYAAGPGRTERVWRFKQPFWRGPDDAPVAEATEHRLS